jgi:hypothetical protein
VKVKSFCDHKGREAEGRERGVSQERKRGVKPQNASVPEYTSAQC